MLMACSISIDELARVTPYLVQYFIAMATTTNIPVKTQQKRAPFQPIVLLLVSLAVGINALIILGTALFTSILDRDPLRGGGAAGLKVHIIIALTLLYLSVLLRRRKRAAWAVVIPVYAFTLGTNTVQALSALGHHHLNLLFVFRDLLFPLLIVAALLLFRNYFMVKSDTRNFAVSLRFVVLALLVTFIYGVVGFSLLDRRDFHHEISLWEAIHRTFDQFNVTTSSPIVPHTVRGRLFLDSLSTVSTAALVYSIISFFQPLKARYNDETHNRERMKRILEDSPSNSEDFFKLWPHDKNYIFDQYHSAGIAYKVLQGVAYSCGAPVGYKPALEHVLQDFEDECRTNDWLPALVHVTDEFRELYEEHGFVLQKLGEEAIIDVEEFATSTRTEKYFRNIANRFKKLDYTFEVLEPPHNDAFIHRLQVVSDEWLALPGRAERGFIMGYFDADYLQECTIVIARDAAGTIQAFLNRIPSYDATEANYDMLRHTSGGTGNINDFVLMGLMDLLHTEGVKTFNLGLCPLAGLDDSSSEDKAAAKRSLINTALSFIYANADRFYSFSGLYRFKSKYRPVWKSRYLAYKGGVRGFTRTITILPRALQVQKHK
jgi:phosphatidylglycerol lysyltransferase